MSTFEMMKMQTLWACLTN